MSGAWRWRGLQTRANGQVALAFYAWDERERAYLPFALNVLSFRGKQVADVTAFITRSTTSEKPGDYLRFPEQPADERTLEATFTRFGMPDRLD